MHVSIVTSKGIQGTITSKLEKLCLTNCAEPRFSINEPGRILSLQSSIQRHGLNKYFETSGL